MAALCYATDGKPFDGSGSLDYAKSYLPCNLTAIANNAHSACCAYGDLCLTNGLCRNVGTDEAAGDNVYWQIGCTDPTFQDPACPKYCNESVTGTPPSFYLFVPGAM
jgi:hypothetical protein